MWQRDQAVPNREMQTIRIEFVNLAKQPFTFLSDLWIVPLSPTTGHQGPTLSLVATVLRNLKTKPIPKREWKVYPLTGPIGY